MTLEDSFFAQLVRESAAVIVVTDANGVVQFVNRAFEMTTGYSAAEVIGQHTRVLNAGVLPKSIYRDLWSTLLSGNVWRGDFCNRKKTGEIYWEAATVFPVRDEKGISHFVAIKDDVTRRRDAEADLERQSVALREANQALINSRRAALSMMQDAHAQRLLAERAMAELERSQHALDAERARLQQILDLSPVGVGISHKSKLTYANRRVTEMLGLKIGDSTNTRFGDSAEFQRLTGVLERSDGATNIPLKAIGADGRPMHVIASFAKIVHENNPAILAWIVDVSELRRVEHALARLAERLTLATRAARVGVWEWRADTNAVSWDDIMYELHGEARGKNTETLSSWSNRILPEDRAIFTEKFQEVMDGGASSDFEYRIRLSDGSIRVLKSSSLVEEDEHGHAQRIIGTNEDMTEVRHVEATLRGAKEAAEAATHAKSAFLANMSHEIRTPMNAILGYAQLLEKDGALDTKQRQQIETIRRSGEHLLTLLNDILEMSKIEAGRTVLNPTMFEPRVLIEEVVALFEQLARDKGISLTWEAAREVPSVIEADQGKVRQIISNLLSNATKFTDRGGIAVSLGRVDATRLSITVSDTGCGIDPASTQHLFQAFEQGAAGARRGGTGLGLAISRGFARLMGGDLTVESEVGVGSSFRVVFGYKPGLQTVAPPMPQLTPTFGLRQPRALVVDDNAANREVLRAQLEALGVMVTLAEGGEEAVRIFEQVSPDRERGPDLVLMDLRMPGMDGFSAMRELRRRGVSVPIVAVSASVFTADQTAALEAGATSFLSKPIVEAELVDALTRFVGVDLVEGESEASPTEESEHVDGLLLQQIREATLHARAERLNGLFAQLANSAPRLAARWGALGGSFRYEELVQEVDALGVRSIRNAS
ncbi:MAG: PAS domain S-box protein [Polyangiaceae bacterium]